MEILQRTRSGTVTAELCTPISKPSQLFVVGRLFLSLWILSFNAWAQPQLVNNDFSYQSVISGYGSFISLRFDAQGYLYAAEKQGRLLRFSPDGVGGFNTGVVVLDIVDEVTSDSERGLLGLELDPDFLNNRLFYLLFSTSLDQRVMRYRANSSFSGIDVGSRTLLLYGLPNSSSFHKAGDMHFMPDDPQNLLVALGDDGRAERAQDLDRYEGKMLRIDKDDGLGVNTNPFYDGDVNSIRSRIWAIGFRNPFRFSFHPALPIVDVMYVSENGTGTDRISWVQRGSDGNWNATSFGGEGCEGGCFLDPADPNHLVLVRPEPAQVGIAIADRGPFAVGGQATLYAANIFGAEVWIRRWTLSGPLLDVVEPVPSDMGVLFANNAVAIDLQFGPDDCLYMSALSGAISRICLQGLFKDGFE